MLLAYEQLLGSKGMCKRLNSARTLTGQAINLRSDQLKQDGSGKPLNVVHLASASKLKSYLVEFVNDAEYWSRLAGLIQAEGGILYCTEVASDVNQAWSLVEITAQTAALLSGEFPSVSKAPPALYPALYCKFVVRELAGRVLRSANFSFRQLQDLEVFSG